MKRWWPWLVVIAVAAAIQIAVVAMVSSDRIRGQPDSVRPSANHDAAAARWQPIAPVALSTLPHHPNVGDRAILYFWATWCEPCVRHLPETLALAAAADVPVWLVARDERWDTVVRYFAGAVPAVVVHDRGLGAALGVNVLPTTFYVDDGYVRARSLDALSRALIVNAGK